ncbi:hypothetical protein PENCOP_c009G08653 [Penicillium coprophilum]|uniref:Uncharacterized protein n=1 Tax=Penicillium coprophilum TaxID=36646 RepID=A0A1V6UHE1_9EURO|nr:hypothetical protein PENCOP_c009G08653 [Penicillium coprophilum]
MSFYKEMVEGDSFDFVANSARCKGLTPIESLKKLCDDTSDLIQALRMLGKAHIGISNAIEAFISGHVTYQLTQRRYRMADLDSKFAPDARSCLKAVTASRE